MACGNDLAEAQSFEVKEKMFGSLKPFIYLQCPACKCLLASDFRQSTEADYPPNYYSFSTSPDELSFRKKLKHVRRKVAIKIAYQVSERLGRWLGAPRHIL